MSGILTFGFIKPERLIGQSEHVATHVHSFVTSNLKQTQK